MKGGKVAGETDVERMEGDGWGEKGGREGDG